jgi:hypothetical protein
MPNVLWILIVILLLVWLLGGLPPLVGWGNGFGGRPINLLWVVIIILVVIAIVQGGL